MARCIIVTSEGPEVMPIEIEVYDNNPQGYDHFQGLFTEHVPGVRPMYEALFTALQLDAGQRVVEVGMGTGLNLPFFPPTVELHGLDRSPAMLALARQRLAQSGRGAEIVEGDAYALPYPDEHFDRVASIFVMCTLDQPAKALAQMHRVCKPGGRIALLDYHRSASPQTRADQEFFAETMRHGILAGGLPVLACDALYELDAHLAGLGFEVVHDERLDQSCSQSFRATVLQKA